MKANYDFRKGVSQYFGGAAMSATSSRSQTTKKTYYKTQENEKSTGR